MLLALNMSWTACIARWQMINGKWKMVFAIAA